MQDVHPEDRARHGDAASRRPKRTWSPPRLIESEIAQTRTGLNVNPDGDASFSLSLS